MASELVKALQKARAQVAHGWTKNKEVRMVFGRRTVCAIQALNDGATMKVSAKGDRMISGSLFSEGVEVLNEAIAELWPDQHMDWETIPEWNDEDGRTKAEVLDTFDRALKIAERDYSVKEIDKLLAEKNG